MCKDSSSLSAEHVRSNAAGTMTQESRAREARGAELRRGPGLEAISKLQLSLYKAQIPRQRTHALEFNRRRRPIRPCLVIKGQAPTSILLGEAQLRWGGGALDDCVAASRKAFIRPLRGTRTLATSRGSQSGDRTCKKSNETKSGLPTRIGVLRSRRPTQLVHNQNHRPKGNPNSRNSSGAQRSATGRTRRLTGTTNQIWAFGQTGERGMG
uniref:Uncharacterized protein n=1 Tax=Kalanchoe fedtschenkoi TaxID=63787 RepID=A0A7N0T424_KALFE